LRTDEVLAGKFAFTARSSCKPAGVPGFDVLLGGALFILQSPTEVTMIFSGNAEARHIRLNSSHSANPKPSWYGESVGHYEGDTLVVDTIGLNDKTFLDNYRTPHTDKLHVTERWRLIEVGLFDRRYKIFDSARRLIIEILREGFADRAVVFAYRWETGDAVFLLRKDVVSYLGEVEKRAFRFVYIRTILATEGHPNRETAIDEEAELLNWFAEQYDVLVQKFKPSLK
jgi:hypothetical protein